MKYINRNGKEVRVSDKKFKEYSEMEENSQIWLDFRCKHFPEFSRECLIMHPSFNMIVWGRDYELYDICFLHGKFWFCVYGKGRIDEGKCFDTPDDAYEYFKKNVGEYVRR